MKARAPGKLLISGAYAVLEGAPAVVAAVDRYVTADGDRPADRVTEEVRAAIDAGALDGACWFDATALRAAAEDGGDRKLGLGSSAAILVATLAARWATTGASFPREELFARALAAHRAAQSGGSGVDVAASVEGGILACRLDATGRLEVTPHTLPPGAVVVAFSSPAAGETSSLRAAVRQLGVRAPAAYAALFDDLARAARAALVAEATGDLVRALCEQGRLLGRLGDAAGVPIVVPAVAELAPEAAAEGAAFLPSGAGGGDVAIFVSGAPPGPRFVESARARGLERLDLQIGAPGVAIVPAAPGG